MQGAILLRLLSRKLRLLLLWEDVGIQISGRMLWRHQTAPTVSMPNSLVIYTSFFSTSQGSA